MIFIDLIKGYLLPQAVLSLLASKPDLHLEHVSGASTQLEQLS